MRSIKSNYLPFLMWFFPLVFFAYQFVLRLWPGLMMHQIMDQFNIDASDFGMLAAFYYYGYALMQIPAAILLDKFGPRIVIGIFAIFCGLATLMFNFTDNFYCGLLSRFLVGAGSSIGFLGVSKIVSLWFSKGLYGKMIGYSFTFGLMGAIYGGKPISLMIEYYGANNIALALAIISILIGLSVLLIIRNPHKAQVANEEFKLAYVKPVLQSKSIWTLAIVNLLLVGTLEGFADVWGVQYLIALYNLSKNDAAGLVSLIFFGMLFGGPVLAWVSTKIGNYATIIVSGIGMMAAFMVLLYFKISQVYLLSIVFFAIGIMCCYQVIVFAAGTNLVQEKSLGITIAFLNCINMLGGSFFHTAIGKTMDLSWNGMLDTAGIRVYELSNYRLSLGLIPLCAALGAIILGPLWYQARKQQ